MYQPGIIEMLEVLAPILLGIAVLVSHRMISGRRDRLRDDPVNLLLTLVGWTFVAVGFLMPFAPMLAMIWIPWWFIAIFLMIEGLRKYRAAQQYALLWLLTVSAERFMPLAPAVEALARERGGLFGRGAMRLAERLAAGESLPDALQKCRKLVPPHALADDPRRMRVGRAGSIVCAKRPTTATCSRRCGRP